MLFWIGLKYVSRDLSANKNRYYPLVIRLPNPVAISICRACKLTIKDSMVSQPIINVTTRSKTHRYNVTELLTGLLGRPRFLGKKYRSFPMNPRSAAFHHSCASYVATRLIHYKDVIMSVMMSQITGASIVSSTVGPGADKKDIKEVSIWWRHHVHRQFLLYSEMIQTVLSIPNSIDKNAISAWRLVLCLIVI